MLRTIILAVVVAVAVTLGCVLLGAILAAVNVSIAATVGAFLQRYSGAIGILAGLWYFFTNWQGR